HASIAQYTRESMKNLGLELLAEDETYASNTVTAIKMPAGVDHGKLMSLMRSDENVVLAAGQGKLTTDIFRIGHLGYVSQEDIEEVVEALKTVLPKVGFSAS
ncbi:MAG: alanine--glyoxylate aminotransferase family protein, partial [Chloroflexi bacterium]|nr:alanine--glyoxylate aminotransferase family protein [Chloroflexota bacterium]